MRHGSTGCWSEVLKGRLVIQSKPGKQSWVHCKDHHNPKTELMQAVGSIRTFSLLSSCSPSASVLSLSFSHLCLTLFDFTHLSLVILPWFSSFWIFSFGYLPDSHFLCPLFLLWIFLPFNSLQKSYFNTSLSFPPFSSISSLPSALTSCILIICHMYNKVDRCFAVKLKGFLIYQNRKPQLSFCLGTSAIHGKGLRNTNEGFPSSSMESQHVSFTLPLFSLICKVKTCTCDVFINTTNDT